MCLRDICAVNLRKQQKTSIQSRPSHYRDSAEEWILQRSSSSPLRVFAYEYHLGREKNIFRGIMKPSTSVSIFTLFCVVITRASVSQADRERESERIDLLISWAGISTLRAG